MTDSAKTIRVKAIAQGFRNGYLRYPGDEFPVKAGTTSKWFKPVAEVQPSDLPEIDDPSTTPMALSQLKQKQASSFTKAMTPKK